MENPFDPEALPRRVMPLFFMVDTSGSMRGAKISSLNTAVREALNDVGEISKNNADAQIKIAALEFSNDVKWMYPQPIEAETFQWQDLDADGMTNFTGALMELNAKLSKSRGFMAEAAGSRAPAIILMSDGKPSASYEHELEKLRGNPWFKIAVKVAIAIGDDADTDMLEAFTGSVETVITVHNVDQLKKIIRTVSVTASTVASQSASVGASTVANSPSSADPNQLAGQAINKAVTADPALKGVDLNGSTANSGTDNWGAGW